MGVDLENPRLGRFDLGFADPAGAVDHLALQVGVIDHVEVDDADAANAGCGQVQQQRRTQAAGANAEDGRGFEPLLALHAHFRQDQVARKTGHLIGAQLDAGGVKGKHGVLIAFQLPTFPNAGPLRPAPAAKAIRGVRSDPPRRRSTRPAKGSAPGRSE